MRAVYIFCIEHSTYCVRILPYEITNIPHVQGQVLVRRYGLGGVPHHGLGRVVQRLVAQVDLAVLAQQDDHVHNIP